MLRKLWNASPASLLRSASYRIRHALKLTQSVPRWHRIERGPAGGMEMLLSNEWPDMKAGRFDAFLYDALNDRTFLNGSTIWDVGAHVGYHTLSFAKLVGDRGKVISFEPNPYNYARLLSNVTRNRLVAERITLERYALADQTTEMELQVSADVDGAMSSCTHLRTAEPPLNAEVYHEFSCVRVPVTTVDDLIAARSGIAPRLMKIDVEGAEHLVLSGAKKCLAAVRPTLMIEVHNITCMFEIMGILNEAEYRCRILNSEQTSKSRCFLMAVASN